MLASSTRGQRYDEGERIMRRVISASLCAWLAMACGPEAADEPEAPGVLEYEHPQMRLYRLGRRIDAFFIRYMGDVEHHECRMLSSRAQAELEDTLAALDPAVDYGCDPETQDCTPETLIHIEGFEHSPFACDVPVHIAGFDQSPFACDFACCRPELSRAALIYWLIGSYFEGFEDPFVFDGEPYVVIEPNELCSSVESRGS
jgi:hypothetical protein